MTHERLHLSSLAPSTLPSCRMFLLCCTYVASTLPDVAIDPVSA